MKTTLQWFINFPDTPPRLGFLFHPMLITFMTINCKSAVVYDLQNGYHEVEITDPQSSDLLTAFELSDIIDHFGEGKILDQIGADTAANHFNLFTDNDVEDNMKPLKEEIQLLHEQLKK